MYLILSTRTPPGYPDPPSPAARSRLQHFPLEALLLSQRMSTEPKVSGNNSASFQFISHSLPKTGGGACYSLALRPCRKGPSKVLASRASNNVFHAPAHISFFSSISCAFPFHLILGRMMSRLMRCLYLIIVPIKLPTSSSDRKWGSRPRSSSLVCVGL